MSPIAGDAARDEPPDQGKSLLSAGELAELDRLRRHLALRSASEGQGSQTSRRRGQSPEFVDHRAYSPGDDLRRLDWNVLARTDQTVIKQFRAEEEAAVRLAVDVTASMDFGTPRKIDLARRIAAAVGYVALADGARAQVLVMNAETVDIAVPKRGRGQYAFIANRLGHAIGDVNPVAAPLLPEATIASLLGRVHRAGVLVIMTDALPSNGDVDAWPRALSRARSAGHNVRFVQILAAEEIDPPWEGDLELTDAETGARVDVSFDAEARQKYAERLEATVNALREGCRRAKASYVQARSDEPLMDIMRRMARGGIE